MQMGQPARSSDMLLVGSMSLKQTITARRRLVSLKLKQSIQRTPSLKRLCGSERSRGTVLRRHCTLLLHWIRILIHQAKAFHAAGVHEARRHYPLPASGARGMRGIIGRQTRNKRICWQSHSSAFAQLLLKLLMNTLTYQTLLFCRFLL